MCEIVNGYVEDFGTFRRSHLWLRGWQHNAFTESATTIRYIHGITGPETELTFDAILPLETLEPSAKNFCATRQGADT